MILTPIVNIRQHVANCQHDSMAQEIFAYFSGISILSIIRLYFIY